MTAGHRVLILFVMREWRDIRTNKQVWPAYLILSLMAWLLPAVFTFALPDMLRGADRDLQSLIDFVRRTPEFRDMRPELAVTSYLQRNFAALYLLIPVALSSMGAAYSVVGEKQQRTLEPILATPITDREFLVGKALAAVLPGILCAWGSALLAAITVDAITISRYGLAILPDRIWAIGVLGLAPLTGAASVLVTMLASARATDPQAAAQFSALVLMPVFFIGLGVFGRMMTLSATAAAVACLLVGLIVIALFRANVVKFRREEILTRWK
jgi:ABC-2 type transport system permease protein